MAFLAVGGHDGASSHSAASIETDIRWELFHHGADIGVRGYGLSREKAFEQAACALTAVMTEPEKVACIERVDIVCDAPDDALLLYQWLNSLVFEMATRDMLFGRFFVAVERGHLVARAWGEPIDVDRHQPAVEVKGATMTELRAEQTDEGGWIAQCVVDV